MLSTTISRFVTKASDQPVSSPAASDRLDPIRVVLPFKDQTSADVCSRCPLKSEDPHDRTARICQPED